MKSLKYLFVALFATLFLCGCGNTDPGLDKGASGGAPIVYATNISINESKLTYFVGDVLNLNNLNISILPADATVKPVFTISDEQLAEIVSNQLTFKGEGSVTLTASILIDVNTYKTYSITFNVETKPIYATSVSIQNSHITINLNDTCINDLIINPVEYNQDVLVTYSNEDVVSYNYQTGLITANAVGETMVTVKVLKSKTETLKTSFNVAVTNHVYAESINNVKINNKTITDTITLFTNETGTISCSVLPVDYNLELTYLCSNNLISINPNGTFIVGNNAGECVLSISALTKTGITYKTINVVVKHQPETLNFKVELNGEEVDYLYSNIAYTLTILTGLDNYNNVTIENCDYTYVSDNVFEIVVSTAGQTNLVVNYNFTSFIGSYAISETKTYTTYNIIKDVNISLVNNNSEIVPNLGVYTIYLPNKNNMQEAISNNAIVYADVNVSAKGVNTKPNALNYEVSGDAIILYGNRIIANSVGESKLTISSNDIGGYSKEIIIKVEPLKVSEIIVESSQVDLYLNGDNLKPNKFTISYSVIPSYAYNTSVEVSTSNNIININENVITALSEGSAQVVLTCENVTQIINVNVSYVPSHICAYLNSNAISNGQEITIETNTDYYLSSYVYSSTQQLSNGVLCYENESLVNGFKNEIKLNYSSEGSHNFKLKFDSFELNFTLKVRMLNPVTKLKFSKNSLKLNMFETSAYTISYFIETAHSNLPTTDKITFTSSNNNVVSVNGTTLNIIATGTAKIHANINGVQVDELSVEIINKEVYYINSLSDFININSTKNYVVMSDLDFSSFTANNCISFSGEIDFNNKTISGLNTHLFSTINNNAVVKNLVISGSVNIESSSVASVVNLDPCFSLISEVNHGTISNITFNNLTINLTNNLELASVSATLVAAHNYGLISNVSLNNVTLSANFASTKVAGVLVSTITHVNHGEVNGIMGGAKLSGFTRAGGVILENYGKLTNVNLTLEFNCTQTKHQIGGLIYKTAVNNGLPEVSNINLSMIVNNVNSSTVTFAGFIYNAASGLSASNITLNHNFTGTFASSTTYLVYYNKPTDVANVSDFKIATNQTFNNYPN